MQRRFDRVYRFLVGRKEQALEISNVHDPRGLHIEFNITKRHSEEPNVNVVTVCNLSPEARKALEVPDQLCELYAGYRDEYGPMLIATGAVTDVYNYERDGTVYTEIAFYDGWIELRDKVISLSYEKGANAHAVIKRICGAMGLPLMMPKGLPNHTWQSGYSYSGSAHGALTRACAAASLSWSIQNQKIQITQIKGRTQREAVVLRSDTGMIGAPDRLRKGAYEKVPVDRPQGKRPKNFIEIRSSRQPQDGYRVTTLLLPQINPHDVIVIDSKHLNGTFMATEVRHQGSLYDGDWQTELTLVTDEQYKQR